MKVLIIIGTRPEAIKFAPLINAFKKDPYFSPIICVTGQHRQMLDHVMDFFEIIPDYDFELMKPDQDLIELSSRALMKLREVIDNEKPDIIFVQGDTTTAFIGGLAGFYRRCPVAHLEAGLRSGDNYSPYPEEVNRKLLGGLSSFHFAPTEKAVMSLAAENITNNVFNVGNTVIDSLLSGLEKLEKRANLYEEKFGIPEKGIKRILLTAHRRESLGSPLEEICESVLHLVEKYEEVDVIYPVHFNPKVRETTQKMLGGNKRIKLIDPVHYDELLWLMKNSYLIMTDSGGIQEEAPSLGKPVIVLREVTERLEGIEAGTAVLTGTEFKKITSVVSDLITNKNNLYDEMSKAVNPYGDGTTSQQVLEILKGITIN